MVIKGDEASVRRFLQEHGPTMLSAVRRCCLQVAPAGTDVTSYAEDLLAQVTISFFGDGSPLLKYDPAKGRSLPTFLRQWVRWRTRDILRTPSKNPWHEISTDCSGLEAYAQEGAQQEALDANFNRLAARDLLRRLFQRISAEKPAYLPLLNQLVLAPDPTSEAPRPNRLAQAAKATREYRFRAYVKQIFAELLFKEGKKGG